jgi:16S rRNA (cytosine967-C5)-methyltransferase
MTDGSQTRALAADLVHRVLDGGAYSNVVVRSATEPLSSQDARFVQRLLYTVLRQLPRIDHTLATYADRPLDRIDEVTRDTLRVGVAEILLLDSSPYAAVDEAVDAVRLRDAPRAAGFVNAVLRKVAARGEAELPSGEKGAALRFGVTEWLYRRLVGIWGTNDAEAFLSASNTPALIGLRMRPEAAFEPGESVPGIADARCCADPEVAKAAIDARAVTVADPASTAVGWAVEAGPGMRVADLAAAPGGKTLQLADAMEGSGTLVAVDRHERRIRSARQRLSDLGDAVSWLLADARQPPLADGRFDRVLLDAPCTGLGTLRRRPEIKHRLTQMSPAAAGKRQRAMLEAGLALLSPGGRLVYSVCTVFPEETIDVIAGHGGRAPDDLPGRPWGDGLLLAPHTTGTDGMFISVFEHS